MRNEHSQMLCPVGSQERGHWRTRASTNARSENEGFPLSPTLVYSIHREHSRDKRLLVFDPRKGDKVKEKLTLQGNPAVKDDWWKNPKTNEEVSFIDFARSEGRFSKHFDKDGNPSETLLAAKQDRLENWHLLQELAGLR